MLIDRIQPVDHVLAEVIIEHFLGRFILPVVADLQHFRGNILGAEVIDGLAVFQILPNPFHRKLRKPLKAHGCDRIIAG